MKGKANLDRQQFGYKTKSFKQGKTSNLPLQSRQNQSFFKPKPLTAQDEATELALATLMLNIAGIQPS